mgnify:CR=1 FL=1
MQFYRDGNVCVTIIPKWEIKRIDFDTCQQPAETLSAYYARQSEKPTILTNGGFFNMSTREPVFNYMDEGKAKATNAKYKWGMGIIGENQLIYGELNSRRWRDFVSGYPNLLDDSQSIAITFAKEINYKARRTLLGYDDDFVMLVCVDNPGMNLIEAQAYMKKLGCKYAINLDGGGSTGMFVNGEKKTSSAYNRAVDNVVAIYTKGTAPTKPTTTASTDRTSQGFLIPDKTLNLYTPSGRGFTVYQKIVPNTFRAPKDVASYVKKGQPIKPCALVNNGTGYPRGITVHNTSTLDAPSGTTPAEVYCRATYNGNMGGAMVHYYVDRYSIWQLLNTAEGHVERGWHAGDGSTRRTAHDKATKGTIIGGNLDTIAIEVIGNYKEAEDNAAKLIAFLCDIHDLTINDIYTHNWFMGQPDDKIIYGARKNCPVYIIPHWTEFLNKVASYAGWKIGNNSPSTTMSKYSVGDKYTIKSNDVYTNGKAVPASIVGRVFTVSKVNDTGTAILLKEINSWVKI